MSADKFETGAQGDPLVSIAISLKKIAIEAWWISVSLFVVAIAVLSK